MKMNQVFESQLHYWTHMLDEAFPDEAMLVEGKHWPEDYIKAAVNKLKAAGKYSGEKTDADVATIAQRFKPKFHTNSALGYFNSVVRWYSEDPNDFIKPKRSDGTQPEDKLEKALVYLKQFLNTQDLVQKDGEKVKQSMSLADFSSMMKKVSDEEQARADNVKFKIEDHGYKIIAFMSYEELNSKFGGDKTGYKGRSEWCHTNGQSTYDSWTENYTKFFFVIAKDNWEVIEPHDNPKENDNAYDEYGLSLMAILVSKEGELLRCTLRWNHIIDPKYTKPGREVDRAFISYAELSQVTGLNVEAEVNRQLAKILERIKKIPKGQKVYGGPEGICFARDHLYWYDQYFNEIDPPEEVEGNFDCSNISITSLKGCPEKVGGSFYCSYTSITSLEGCPRIVGGNFSCLSTEITSLKGCPEKVGGSFWCAYTNITSLEGCPKIVNGDFNCSRTLIASLEGTPKIVEGNFQCQYTIITSLKGCPRIAHGDFDCTGTKIASLEGCPEKVGGNFICRYTSIASLEGCPKEVGGSFGCAHTKITSLEGGPEEVGGNFQCSYTNITSLEGAPKTVNGHFNCFNTKITSLKGAPAKIGVFEYSRFPKSISSQQLVAYKKWLKTNPKENYLQKRTI